MDYNSVYAWLPPMPTVTAGIRGPKIPHSWPGPTLPSLTGSCSLKSCGRYLLIWLFLFHWSRAHQIQRGIYLMYQSIGITNLQVPPHSHSSWACAALFLWRAATPLRPRNDGNSNWENHPRCNSCGFSHHALKPRTVCALDIFCMLLTCGCHSSWRPPRPP